MIFDKKEKRWLIRNKLWDKVEYNIKQYNNDVKGDIDLISAFIWSWSEEGHNFWFEVSVKINKIGLRGKRK